MNTAQQTQERRAMTREQERDARNAAQVHVFALYEQECKLNDQLQRDLAAINELRAQRQAILERWGRAMTVEAV